MRPHRHRSLLAGAALAAALAAPSVARAADIRVGYIDSARIFLEYKDAQEAQQRFDRQVQGWKDEAAEKEKTVNQLRAEVRDEGPILSALKRQEKETALQNAISAYEQFIQQIWGPNGQAAQANDQATKTIVDQVRAAVEKVAGERGLEMVFDAAGGFLVYADKTLDLTTDVLTELNARSSSSTTPGAH